VGTVEEAYTTLGLTLSGEARARMGSWAAANPPGSHGTHEYALEDFGITGSEARRRFRFYAERFDVTDGAPPAGGR
jgi:hypothetical protein